MSLIIDGTDVGEAIEIALNVGGVIAMLVIALLIYLMVRPPRRQEVVRIEEPDEPDMSEMLRLMERMEQRLEVLERAVAPADGRELVESGAESAGTRRKQ